MGAVGTGVGARININGVTFSDIERVKLSKAWLEESENAVVGTDQNGREFFAVVTAKFLDHMDSLTAPVRGD